MLYCVAGEKYPLKYISSGNLISENGFLHPNRNLDSWVFILINQGTLHITQNNQEFDVQENQTILLFPHQTHFGHKKSDGYLSYFWVHFYITDPDYKIYSRRTLLRSNSFSHFAGIFPDSDMLEAQHTTGDYFILPEYSSLFHEKRTVLLFHQLLDMAKRDNYHATWRCHYALNLLLSEFTAEFLSGDDIFSDKIPGSIKEIIEWIRVHYEEPLTVASLAKQFNYHPTYLTALIKKHTGHTVSDYITSYRIIAAKNLLTRQQPKFSNKSIAFMCGFKDEKYFLRVFKKVEGITPGQYRRAFHEKKINIK
ncbi:MAG: AraC family transcriptional regulator [Eubacteriales bacterium]|nr:AraC family transcriptional regulator [Eubacteriales bacterium]